MSYIKLFEEFVEELDEAVDVKYWEGYNKSSSRDTPKDWEDKETDFEDIWEDAIEEWNSEADKKLSPSQIKRAEKVAREFFKKTKWISMNIALAMISQES